MNDETIILNQSVFAGSMQGVLPRELPAGKMAVAFGAEYRHETGGVTQASPLGATGGWAAGNFGTYKGKYNVEEAFLEVDVPLLKDNFVQTLNLNAAGRITEYSTSGLVETWKLGLTSQVNDDIRLRTTWSLDIRAPLDIRPVLARYAGPADLHLSGKHAQLSVLPTARRQSRPATGKAITVSGGIVLTPHWIEGLTLSADWYSINIHGAIFATGFQTVLNRCGAGETIYCGQIITNASGLVTQVNVFPLNAASDSISGLDFKPTTRDFSEWYSRPAHGRQLYRPAKPHSAGRDL